MPPAELVSATLGPILSISFAAASDCSLRVFDGVEFEIARSRRLVPRLGILRRELHALEPVRILRAEAPCDEVLLIPAAARLVGIRRAAPVGAAHVRAVPDVNRVAAAQEDTLVALATVPATPWTSQCSSTNAIPAGARGTGFLAEPDRRRCGRWLRPAVELRHREIRRGLPQDLVGLPKLANLSLQAFSGPLVGRRTVAQPRSRWACRTQRRNVSALQPILDAIEQIAAHSEA